MHTTLERVSVLTLGALLLWVVVAVLICAWIRSGRLIGNWTAARQNMVLGLLLVLASVSTSTYSWNQVDQFKTYQSAETEALQDDIDRRNADTYKKNCDRRSDKTQPCPPAKPGVKLSVYSEPLHHSLDKVVEIIGLVLGLLGGALGVNLITDGLLKKDPPKYSLVRRNESRVTRTFGLKGWKHEELTVEYHLPSSAESAKPPTS